MSQYNEIINCGGPDWAEHVRKRPQIYIRKTDIEGLHRLITLLVESAFDECITEGCIKLDFAHDNFRSTAFG
jgi:DNA gyrase/topoisomerase IV subunit B